MSDAPTLQLPPGGGAVAASGTDFDVDLNTGTAGLSLPVDLPAGPNAIRPELALRYHSGAGAGWLGLGWTLGLPRITMRRTRAADGTAAVPALDGVGPLRPRADGGWAPEIDTFGQRILGGPDTGWQLVDIADTVHSLGSSPASRTVDDAGRTVAWLLDAVTDSSGNTIGYGWEPGDGYARLSSVTWGRYQLRLVYEPRPDVLTEGSLGVLLTIRSRLRAIELHRPDLAAASLLRSWELAYQQDAARSLLSGVAQFAHGPDGAATAGSRVTFDYTAAGAPALRALPQLPVALHRTGTQLVDLTGDGLPDLLDLTGPRPRWWQNLGGGAFGGARRPRRLPEALSVSPQSVGFVDVDGDGTADLVMLTERFAGYFPLGTAGAAAFTGPVRWRQAPPYSLDDPSVRLLDLDGDGRGDLLVERGGRWWAWLQDPHGGWQPFPAELVDRPPVSLADPRVMIADVTGDGGLDVVQVTGAALTYWPSLGSGRWAAPTTVTIPQAPPRLDPGRLMLLDADGDGCADLVYLDDGRALLWQWAGTETLLAPRTLAALPPTGPGSFRPLDLEGTGTSGVLLDLPRGRHGFLDLLGGKPYLLRRVSDAGATTTLSWRTSTRCAADDADAGMPWRTFHPFPVQVVAQIATTDAATGVTATTSYRYHEARYDPVARTFLGFGAVDRDDLGDEYIPTRRQSTTFHLGLDPADPTRPLTDDERVRFGALRRKPLTVTVSDPVTGAVDSVVRYTYDVVSRPTTAGPASLLPFTSSTVLERWDGQAAPVSTHTVDYLDVDLDGIVARQRSVVARAGQPADRDVTIHRDVVSGGAHLRLPCRTREVDAEGTVLADTITYYDGPDEVGLPFGSATEGLVTRIEDLVLTDATVTEVWGDAPPDLASLGYHRLDGEAGWWVARSRLARAGAVLRTRGPLGGVSVTTLDPTRHDVVALTDPLGHTQTATYDARTGTLTTLIGVDGGVRHESFDALGRVTGYWPATDPGGAPIATWAYDTSTVPVRVTSTGGETSEALTYLDGRGDTLLTLTPTGDPDTPWLAGRARTPTTRGQVALGYLPYPTASAAYAPPPPGTPHSRFEYDLAGRVTREVRADGSQLTWAREPDTVTVSVTPPGAAAEQPRERHTLDACGQARGVARWDGERWVEQTYTWDHRGRPVTVTTPDGVVHTLVHDLLGRMIGHTSADTGTTRRLVDAQGGEVRTVLATGDEVTREFDPIGRMTKLWRTGHGDPDVVWEYLRPSDPAPPDGERHRTGRLWRVSDPLGVLTLAYDAAGRVTSKARTTPHVSWPVVTDAEYDAHGRLTAAVLPPTSASGTRRRVEYTHDAVGRPVAARGVVDGVAFDAQGRTTRIRHSNGVTTSLTYDPVTGQVSGQDVTGPHGEHLRAQTCRYDDEHRLVGTEAPGETNWAYAFDGLGRLGSATRDDGPASAFRFSDGGNMLTSPLGEAQSYVPGTSRLAGPYTYDAAGRMTSAPWGTLQWDGEDHLLSTGTATHAYDHTGARVLSRRADGTVYHLRAGDDLLVTETGAVALIRFAGVLVATSDDTDRLSWCHPDVLGNVTLVTDATAAVSTRLTLDPWGNVVSGGIVAGVAGFLGSPPDPSGLICLGCRWYDPRTGRFLSPDPFAGGLYTIGAWNPYAYGLNNPVLLCDPSGLTSIWAIIGVSLLVALVVVAAVATAGVALAGVAVLGVTFAAEGASAATLTAVGIGAFGGALAGAMSADRAGGDPMLGALVGGVLGGATALIGGALGAAVVKSMAGAATWASSAVSGAVQGAVGGFGSGMAAGFAGGKGSLGDIMLGGVRGMVWGATLGLALGGVLGGKFANAQGEHNYLELGTLHKYGIGFGSNVTDTPSDFDLFDNMQGTAFDVGSGVHHAAGGTFGVGNDVFGNVIDVANVPRNVGSDLGLFTTDIPGTLFAVDANAVAGAFATNGLGAAVASVSVGADAAGLSYADQVLLGLKGVPLVGNWVGVLDDFGAFNTVKRDFNTFYGSSTPAP